jgi:DNA-binding GntR family transcriptional regulator
LKELAASGLIEIRHGSGTFVAPKKLAYDPTLPFLDQSGRFGKTRVETLNMEWEDPHRDAAELLSIEPGDQVWSVLQLGYIDETPAAVLVADIPEETAKHLMGDSRRIDAMFDALRNDLGHDQLDIDVIKVDILSERFYWDLLKMPAGGTLYEVRRVVSSRGKPLMMSYLGVRTDKFCLDFRGADRFKGSVRSRDGEHPDWTASLYERLTRLEV